MQSANQGLPFTYIGVALFQSANDIGAWLVLWRRCARMHCGGPESRERAGDGGQFVQGLTTVKAGHLESDVEQQGLRNSANSKAYTVRGYEAGKGSTLSMRLTLCRSSPPCKLALHGGCGCGCSTPALLPAVATTC